MVSTIIDRRSLAAAKHAAFVRARGRHYSNEAEAMKVFLFIYFLLCLCLTILVEQRAAKLMEEEDEATPDTESGDISLENRGPSQMIVNGVVHTT
jgi:hypothetical protein